MFGRVLKAGRVWRRPQVRMSSDDVKMLQVAEGRHVACRVHEGGTRDPTVVFVPGFMSTMDGLKAQTLLRYCQQHDNRLVRFDFEGIGRSPGSMAELFAGHWIEDLECVLSQQVPHRALLVGSSMGGWFSLKVAERQPHKVHSLLLVAPAINFFKFYYDFFYKSVSPQERQTLDSGDVLVLKKNFGEIFLRKSMMEESLRHHLDLSKPLNVNVPVRILHGVLDPDVPYKQSLQIMQALTSPDVEVTYRKSGQHQMSEQRDLRLLTDILRSLLVPSHL